MEVIMPTERLVRHALRDGHDHEGQDYERAAARLGIPPGRAYMIATGRPADGSTPGEPLGSRAQSLVNPREVNPTSRDDVHEWLRRMAHSDASMRQGRDSTGDGAK
jgi:hypothetical protein